MQTVNFNCPHCGNLMAVGTNLLGRNVRCPHCKQVVRAPAAPSETAPAPPPPPPPTPSAPPDTIPTPVPQFKLPEQTEHHESIFGERHEEDVFGSEPLKPAVPPPVAPPPPAPPPYLQETVGITAEAPAPRPAPRPEYEPLPEDSYPARRNREPEPQDREEEAPTETEAPRRYQSRAPREESASTGPFAWILLGYGAFITIVAGFFAFQYFTGGPSKDRYDIIPDVYGQYEKANRRQVSVKGLPDPKGELPPELRVKLGGELTVGDLQVKPVSVERRYRLTRIVKKPVEGEQERPYGAHTLVLTLHVKNLSNDTTFHPNDPAFNRAFDKAMPMPYTALEFRNQFHYGPLPWPTEAGNDDEYITGFGLEKDAAPLAAGAEADVFVAVAPKGTKADVNNLGSTLDDRPWENVPSVEPFFWRVQLRRGLVKAEMDGQPVEISATTVIGVSFTKADVR
jgi:hypothetical protein